MVEWALAAGLGYFIGSFPTAYLLVRWKSRLDIRAVGSGNVGTLNSYEVTGSKFVGGLVLVADLLKGMISVLIARLLLGSDFGVGATAGIGAVVGHNFPMWLGFKGGRGLATATGVGFMVAPIVVGLWGVLWSFGFSLFRDVNAGNVVATGILLGAFVFLSGGVIQSAFLQEASPVALKLFGISLMTVILLKHVDPIREFLRARRNLKQVKKDL